MSVVDAWWFLTGVDRWVWASQGFILIRALKVRWNDNVLSCIYASAKEHESLWISGVLRPELNNRQWFYKLTESKITTDFTEFTYTVTSSDTVLHTFPDNGRNQLICLLDITNGRWLLYLLWISASNLDVCEFLIKVEISGAELRPLLLKTKKRTSTLEVLCSNRGASRRQIKGISSTSSYSWLVNKL
jgi:hypothetical protein